MERTKNMPIWVYLAWANIDTRRSALLLLLACVIFTLYCIPWVQFFAEPAWLEKLFLIQDWSWFAMMLPITAWYGLSLRWVDRHGGWSKRVSISEFDANALAHPIRNKGD